MSVTRSYEANVTVLNASKGMPTKALEMVNDSLEDDEMAGISLTAANNVANLTEATNTKKTTPYEAQQSFATFLKDSITL